MCIRDSYISVPNYGIALPDIEKLNESAWIVDRLLVRNMPRVDAVTIAQVLRDVLKNLSLIHIYR